MNTEKLSKKYGDNYKIENGKIKRTSDKRKVCNFYIESVTIYTKFKIKIFFEVEYVFHGESFSTIIPYEYYNDPSGWVNLFTDPDIKIKLPKLEFDRAILEITNKLSKLSEPIEIYEKDSLGWSWTEHKDDSDILTNTVGLLEFRIKGFDDDDNIPDFITDKTNYNSMLKFCVDTGDCYIGVPLVVYTLYSLICRVSLNTCIDKANNLTRHNMIMSITGGKSDYQRNKTALFYTNLFVRDINRIASDYKAYHVFSTDSPSSIKYKSLRINAGVLIAFDPSKPQFKQIKRFFAPEIDEEQYDSGQSYGMALIVKNDTKGIPYKTINIDIPDGCDVMKKWKLYNNDSEYDHYMKDVYNFMLYLQELNINQIKEIYNRNISSIKNKLEYLSEDARYVAERLTFASKLYWKYMSNTKIINSKEYTPYKNYCENAIIEIAKNSFHKSKDITFPETEQAIELCRRIDDYFKTKKNQSQICNIGTKPKKDTIKVWCDDETINISSENMKDLTTILKQEYNLSIRKALSELQLIKIYSNIGKRKSTEYTQRIQKLIINGSPSKSKYVRFKRDACKKLGLFSTIMEISDKLNEKQNQQIY